MNGIIRRNTAVLLVIAILLLTNTMVLADGGEDGYVVTANGFRVELVFNEPTTIGKNEFHIQITDSMGVPVSNAEVEASAMPAEVMPEHNEDEEIATEAPSVGVMISNNSMDGMEMATEAPSTGVMKPDEPAEAEHGEEVLMIMLEPTSESGEYSGELHFDASGEWMLNVHFTVDGETTKVEFPIDIARMLALNYAVLAGFFGINGTLIAAAAFLKRKSVVVRK